MTDVPAYRCGLLSLLLCSSLWSVGSSSASAQPGGDLLLATTTSVRDSGLLDELLPRFEEETGIRLRYVAVGSGAALRMGEQGSADALLTHAPRGERELLAAGAVSSRTPFMENWFVIAGPREDPAGIGAAGTAVEAFRRIWSRRPPYVSRGDDSGTHRRERQVLAAAGLDPEGGWEGFASTGSGMGLSLQVAGERRAYVLSDLGTFLAYRRRVELEALFSREEEALRNEYSFLRVNPERFSGIHAREARAFEDFLLRSDVQELIANFATERFGQPLFRPLHDAGLPGTE